MEVSGCGGATPSLLGDILHCHLKRSERSLPFPSGSLDRRKSQRPIHNLFLRNRLQHFLPHLYVLLH
jgi:hypothetical protein